MKTDNGIPLHPHLELEEFRALSEHDMRQFMIAWPGLVAMYVDDRCPD